MNHEDIDVVVDHQWPGKAKVLPKLTEDLAWLGSGGGDGLGSNGTGARI